MATRVLETFNTEDSIYNCEPEFECGYFDAVIGDPLPGLNLVIYGQRPKHEKRAEFLARVRNELVYHGVQSAFLFSLSPLYVQESTIAFDYVGVFEEKDKIGPIFGPFHQYIVRIF